MKSTRTASIFISLLAACILPGCATNIDYDPAQADSGWEESFDGWKIAVDYYRLRTKTDGIIFTLGEKYIIVGETDPRVLESFENILVDRGLKSEHIALIRKGEICTGMHINGLYAAWGPPRRTNIDVVRGIKFNQHVYGSIQADSHSSHRRKYAYTRNGVITSFSLR